MTVSYNFDASSTTWFSPTKILFRWRGSVWKAVFSEALTWILLFIGINAVIRHQFNDIQMRNFKEVRNAVRENLPRIPLAFLLGFFVSVVFNRWAAIFNHIGFIDNLALSVSVIIRGSEPETKLLKRNIIRYAVLSQTLVFRDISIQVRKRFPHVESIVKSGIMMQKELEIFERKEMQDNKYWLPIQWAMMLVLKARQEEKICNDVIMFNIMEFRTDLQYLCCYDWVPVPMSYPQIVFLAVRFYFFCQLIARQSLPIDQLDIFVPIMTLMELLLLVGWVKVAEALLNPFGETGFEIVELYDQPPCNEYDKFWQMAIPKPLDSWSGGVSGNIAATPALKKKQHRPYHGSVADLNFESKPQTSFYNPTTVHDPFSINSKTTESIRRRLSRKLFPFQIVVEKDQAVDKTSSKNNLADLESTDFVELQERKCADRCQGADSSASLFDPFSSNPQTSDDIIKVSNVPLKKQDQPAEPSHCILVPTASSSPSHNMDYSLDQENQPKRNSVWFDIGQKNNAEEGKQAH